MISPHAPGSEPVSEYVEPLAGWEMADGRTTSSSLITPDQQYWYLLGRRAGGASESRRGDSLLQQLRLELDQLRQEMAAARTGAPAANGGRLTGPFRRPQAQPVAVDTASSAVPVAAVGDLAVLRPRSNPQPEKVVVVAALGIGDEELERVAGMAAGQMATGRVLPIVLTDSDRLDILRRHRLPLEYLPPPASQRRFAPDKNWNLYLRRRFAIICRKWRPGAVIVFGGGSGLLIEAAKELGLMPA